MFEKCVFDLWLVELTETEHADMGLTTFNFPLFSVIGWKNMGSQGRI